MSSHLEDKLGRLKAVIDETVTFPSDYVFKFIVPLEQIQHLLVIVEEIEGTHLEKKPSQNGNYISVTLKIVAYESEDILIIYRKASKVKGIISL